MANVSGRHCDASDRLLNLLASSELDLSTKPHIVVVRNDAGEDVRYVGPFDSAGDARAAAEILEEQLGTESSLTPIVTPLFPA